MKIENTIFSNSLPVNTIPLLHRIEELLKENNTNSLTLAKKDIRIEKCLWLLMNQYFEPLTNEVNLNEMWEYLRHKEA